MRGTKQARQHGYAPLLLVMVLWLTSSPGFMQAQHDPEFTPMEKPDLNRDGQVDVLDLVGLLHLFQRTDMDNDGIWDHEDDCVGWYDACGVCNGPGPTELEVVAVVPRMDSLRIELTGEWFSFQTGTDTIFRPVCDNPGCLDPLALNFDPLASRSEPLSCEYPREWDACEGKTAIVYHNHIYPVIPIGDQCWFAENLRTEKFRDNSPIPTGKKADLWSNMGTNDLPAIETLRLGGTLAPAQLEVYYNHHAVMDARGICPVGWRVPTDGDWQAMIRRMESRGSSETPLIQSAQSLGARMKVGSLAGVPHLHTVVAGGQNSASAAGKNNNWVPYWDGSDEIGFGAEPVGVRDRFGFFDYVGHAAAFWSATTAGKSFAWAYFLGEANPELARMNLMMPYGLSVRCVH
jgi:uncharacterized protein (TIGR02145 family)